MSISLSFANGQLKLFRPTKKPSKIHINLKVYKVYSYKKREKDCGISRLCFIFILYQDCFGKCFQSFLCLCIIWGTEKNLKFSVRQRNQQIKNTWKINLQHHFNICLASLIKAWVIVKPLIARGTTQPFFAILIPFTTLCAFVFTFRSFHVITQDSIFTAIPLSVERLLISSNFEKLYLIVTFLTFPSF